MDAPYHITVLRPPFTRLLGQDSGMSVKVYGNTAMLTSGVLIKNILN